MAEENIGCRAVVGPVVGSGSRIPSRVIWTAVVGSSVQRTGFWILDRQIVVGGPGMDSGTGVRVAQESYKNLARFARVPIAAVHAQL